MTWNGIRGHDGVAERFRQALVRRRLASTFLFVGPAGIGKRSFALKLAQGLLCEANREQELSPCGVCPPCQQVLAQTHPDLLLVAKPDGKRDLPVELFIGDRDHRMREGLCHDISLKPFCGGRKIAIIDDADYLNVEGANCLLKTLEEPPPRSMLILISTSEQRQLPTIRSRCQTVRFQPLAETTVAELLLEQGMVDDAEQARRLADLSGGSLQRALDLSDEALAEFRQVLLLELSQPDWDPLEFCKTVTAFVNEAGKEAPPRRNRMIQLMGFAAEFYEHLLRSLSAAPLPGDQILQRAVHAAHQSWADDALVASACLERCLEAQDHVRANANQATLLECWLDDLASATRG